MESIDRRGLIAFGASLGAIALVGCAGKSPARAAHEEHEEGDEEVAPPEDLMREHGVLNRLLLVYEESIRRLEGGAADLSADTLTSATGIIRRFIEDYHEKLEEDFLFPRFEKAGKLVELVATLRKQHQAGRLLTDDVQRLATASGFQGADGKRLATVLRSFVRMYRPHEAREDTVLFPALRSVVTPKEFKSLGEQFEEKEHQLFGKEGFEGIVEQVAKIEQTLGIYDLNQFTP